MLVFRLQRLVCAVVCASCPALTAGGAMIFEETLPTQTIMVQGQQAVGAIGVSFAGFNSQGGNRVLLGARVTISQTGSALMALDNEDEQVGGDVIAVVARSFSVFGPGISSDGLDIFDQANSAIVTLTASTEQPAGDPDFEGPDSTNFGAIGFSGPARGDGLNSEGEAFLDPLLFVDALTVDFLIDEVLITNSISWVAGGPTPAEWALKVEDSQFEVSIGVTYLYEPIPAPGGAAVLLAGLGFGAVRRRARA